MTGVALSFVHHANQLVITDGYANRDGISRVCAGYVHVLELHRKYGIPASLHLSGTLLEAMLWHAPEQFAEIRRLVGSTGIRLVGGTYSEPIMPTLSPEMNRLQIATMTELIAEHFPQDRTRIRTAWLPERVWSPELHSIFTDPSPVQGPFDRVLVDDRLLTTRSATQSGPFHWEDRRQPPDYRPDMVDPDSLRPRTVMADGRPLTMVPICSYLRYLFPPRSARQWDFLHRMLADLAERSSDGEPVLLVYADDMERAAGVGGWEPAIEDYEHLLAWLATGELVHPVDMDTWLDSHHFPETAPVRAGSYHELEVDWGAGADFTGWSGDPQWAPYAELLTSVETMIRTAERRVSCRDAAAEPLSLAYRLLMLGQHETAWRDPVSGCVDGMRRHLAPWVRATAAHAALARPLVTAAYWSADGGCIPHAEQIDIDGDGESELVLADAHTWCVISPRRGARVTLMCRSDSSGCPVIVGNPADHWNFQEELHRFMDEPAAHPGALTEHDCPHDEWFARPSRCSEGVIVHLYRRGDAEWSRRYALLAGIPGLVARIHLTAPGGVIDNFLTPDYLRALTRGERGIPLQGTCFTGREYRDRSSWIGFDPAQAIAGVEDNAAAGHGHLVRLSPIGTTVDCIIGSGPVTDHEVRTWLELARTLPDREPLHESTEADPDALAGEMR